MFSLTPGFEQLSLTEQIKEVNELTSRNPLPFLQIPKDHIDLPTLIRNRRRSPQAWKNPETRLKSAGKCHGGYIS